MTNQVIPTEAVEAAKRVAFERYGSKPDTAYLRTILEAAAPYIRAEALEQAASVAETGEGGGTDSGECDDWSAWLRGRAAAERTTDAV